MTQDPEHVPISEDEQPLGTSTKNKKHLSIWLPISVVLVVLAALLYTYLAKREMSFDPIEALPFEAMMMEEDEHLESLDLVSSNFNEVEGFLKTHGAYEFTPVLLHPAETAWNLQGAAVLDYGLSKIILTRFENVEHTEALFFFAFSGQIEDLSGGQRVVSGPLSYQSFKAENMQLIAWQYDARTVGILVGHEKPSDLVKIISEGQLTKAQL